MKTYISAREKIVGDLLSSVYSIQDEYHSGKYNLVSAGLYNYLPAIGFDKHETIFKNILLNQKLSCLEQSFPEVTDLINCENWTAEIQDILENKPSIICTFHTGSYRVINQFLLKHKIPFTLVVASSVLKNQGEQFKKIVEKQNSTSDESYFDIIDAEQPNAGIQMLRKLKMEHRLVIYIDGNTGTMKKDEISNNLCDIQFLNQRIYARMGVSFIAHAANVPIIPVVCYRPSLSEINLYFGDPIYPNLKKSRKEFAEHTTQVIYNFAAPIIKLYPEQWEGWLYLHKIININVLRNKELKFVKIEQFQEYATLRFNNIEYGLLKIEGSTYLLKKNGYISFPISYSLYNLLIKANTNSITKYEFDELEFEQLIQNMVLILAENIVNE
jgi:lauroyl/myristoyl acyltransferase